MSGDEEDEEEPADIFNFDLNLSSLEKFLVDINFAID